MVDELDLLRQLIDADPVPDDPRVTNILVERVMAQTAPELSAGTVHPLEVRRVWRRPRSVTGVRETDSGRPARPSRLPWYRTSWLAGAAIAASLAAGGSVAYAELAGSRAPTYLGEARCYSVASLRGGNNFYGLTVAASGRPGTRAVVSDALATCTVDWQQGFLALGQPALRTQLPPAKRKVPPLVACVLRDGIAAVFPGDPQTCQKLGLSAEKPAPTGS